MDPLRNPFSPGAGAPPPELVGRDAILDQARTLFGRMARTRAEKSMILTGLRGVGKTVLLNAIERLARDQDHMTVSVEAEDGLHLAGLIAPHIRNLLYELDRAKGLARKTKLALAVLRSFISGIRVKVGEIDIGLDIEPLIGSADSGDLELDLTNLFVAVAEAAQERSIVVVILIDEIQYLDGPALSALIRAMHRLQQLQLPLTLVGAGLPTVRRLAGDAKSYSERLFSFPEIGPLSREDSDRALGEPTRSAGVAFGQEALDAVYDLARGYPYFLQEWGYLAWNTAVGPGITRTDIDNATGAVVRRLDENFFRVRFDRLIPTERQYLRAMAELGPGPHRSGDVALQLGRKSSSYASRLRDSLIKKGMVYSPSYGDIAFTVPLFDQFMKRVMPEFP